MAQGDRPIEQPAVKTTIVGGRPPGCGRPLGPIPRGIEVLIKKAAVDAEFKALLLANRDAAAMEIGLALDPAEAMMLRSAQAGQLEAIIARTQVAPSARSAFLGRAAAMMLAALGAGTIAGCDQGAPSTGILPDKPAAAKPAGPVKTAGASLSPTVRIRWGGPAGALELSLASPSSPAPAPPKPQPNQPVSRGVRPDKPAAKPTDPPPSTATQPSPAAQAAGDQPAAREPILSKTLALPPRWDEKAALDNLAVGLKKLADSQLPEHRFTYNAEGSPHYVHIAWKTQAYDVPVAGKEGGNAEVRRKTGPTADGLMLTVWIEKRLAESDRPQVLDNAGFWKTRIDQVFLQPLKTYLKFNVHYGPKTPEGLIKTFSTPAGWLAGEAPAEKPPAQKAETQTRAVPAGAAEPAPRAEPEKR
jgi:hypothetical protein